MSKMFDKWIRLIGTILFFVIVITIVYQFYFDCNHLFNNNSRAYSSIDYKEYAFAAYLMIYLWFLIRRNLSRNNILALTVIISGFFFDIFIFKSFEGLRYLAFYQKSIFYSLLLLLLNPILFSGFFIAKNRLLGANSKKIVYLIIIFVLITEVIIFKDKKWKTTCIANIEYSKFITLDLKENKIPYIGYSSPGNKSFILSHFSGLKWVKTSFENKGTSKYISMLYLKFDNNEKLYSCYLDNDLSLRFAEFNGNGWKSIKEFKNVSMQSNVSLVFDSNNKPCISFAKISADRTYLYYGKFDGKKWDIQKIDTIPKVAFSRHSLVLDSEGNPHMSYCGENKGVLKYAFFQNGEWHNEVIDNNENAVSYSSIAIGRSNEIYICYCDHINKCLKLANIEKGKCRIEIVDDSDAGKYNCIKTDSNGNIHICYSDNVLKYAFFNGNSWKIESVESSWIVPHEEIYITLSIDQSNNPKISYFDEKSHCVIFAFFQNNL